MLTLENVLKLAELGFTKDEIMQFSNSEQQVEVKEEPAVTFTPPADPAPLRRYPLSGISGKPSG